MKNTQVLLQKLEEVFLSKDADVSLPPYARTILHDLKEHLHTNIIPPTPPPLSLVKDIRFDRAPVSIITLNRQGVLLSLNREASEMLDIRSLTHASFFDRYLNDESTLYFKAHIERVFETKKPQRTELKIAYIASDNQLHEHDIMLDSVWMQNSAHPHGYSLSVCSDISGFKKMQSALETGRIQAEKASSMKSQFLANMSHEIRTPLSSVLGYVDLLRQDIQVEEQREKLEIVYKAGKHLLYLINEIIDLSRIEQGKFELKNSPFLLSAMLNELQNLFEIAAEKRDIQLVFTRRFLDTPLLGDATRIRQVLMNVIGNAIKFTPPHGKVEVYVSYQVGYLNIRVSDTGMGIEQNQIEAIFEMFHQADNSDTRTHGGSGLGLAISKRLVHMMRGSIDIESSVGAGSTFTVRIPLTFAPDEDDYNETSGVLPVPFFATDPTTIPRVLIVDDDRVLQRLLGIFVGRMGYDYSIAIHGKDALQKLQEAEYSLVLLDLQMPVMDGYETVKHMREQPEYRNLPVIALTAKAIQDDLDRCLAEGCDTYLTKPIVYKQLAQHIHRYLRPIETNEKN